LAEKQPPVQKCVIAYRSRSPAPIMNGTKQVAEAVDIFVVGERGTLERSETDNDSWTKCQ
jgi:hypothetical protein